MWLTDRSRSNDSRVGAAPLGKYTDSWRAFRSHHGTRRIAFYDAELWATALALQQSVKTRNALQTHLVMKEEVFSNWQAAIRLTEDLEPGPVQHLTRWVDMFTRKLSKAWLETEIDWVPGHADIPGNEVSYHQANLSRGSGRGRTV